MQVLDVDFERERISLSLKATQQDPWQEFASTHEVGQLVYGRVTKLVPFGAFVQVGDGIEGLVHISEMSTHHVDAPEQVVTPGEELWVKIIDLDLARRRISLSIKQAAEGGELAEEYRQHFEVDEHGNWTAGGDDAEREAAWAEYYENNPDATPGEAEARSKQRLLLQQAAAAAAEAPAAPAEAPAQPARSTRRRRVCTCRRRSAGRTRRRDEPARLRRAGLSPRPADARARFRNCQFDIAPAQLPGRDPELPVLRSRPGRLTGCL